MQWWSSLCLWLKVNVQRNPGKLPRGRLSYIWFRKKCAFSSINSLTIWGPLSPGCFGFSDFFRFGKFVNIHQPRCTCTGSSISIIDFGMARAVLMNDQSSKIKCKIEANYDIIPAVHITIVALVSRSRAGIFSGEEKCLEEMEHQLDIIYNQVPGKFPPLNNSELMTENVRPACQSKKTLLGALLETTTVGSDSCIPSSGRY